MAWRLGIVGILTILLGVFCYFNFDAIMQSSRVQMATGNPAPSPRLLETVLAGAHEPSEVVTELWNTRSIPQRQAAIGFLRERAMTQPGLLDVAQLIGPEALRDPDIDVQRDALQLMRGIGEAKVWAALPGMLRDADPQVRLMWLEYLVRDNDPRSTPLAASCLSDPDPRVQTLAIRTLGKWSGQDFGLTADDEAPASDAAVAACRTWWAEHREQYAKASLPANGLPAIDLPSVDFQLSDTQDRSVALSSFFGRPVLLHFWVTTDPTCRKMAAELNRLRTKVGSDGLAIVSVALDGVSGGAGGAARYQADDDGTLPFDERMTQAIAAAAQAEGLDYPVLIENTGRTAGAYEGFDVPVTVWIDVDGLIRRRLTDFRSAAVLEAMYQQVRQPIGAPTSAAVMN